MQSGRESLGKVNTKESNFSDMATFIWNIADDILRGDYRPNQYGWVILPFVVLRRLDCVLDHTKEKVLDKLAELKRKNTNLKDVDPILNRVTGQPFHNKSKYSFEKLKDDPDNVAANLREYISKFSPNAREILEKFDFEKQIAKLDQADLLYMTIKSFAEIDLHPDNVSNRKMGYIYEELIRRFNEASNETAGEHFTPREVIRLMVNLLFAEDSEILCKKEIIRTLYDPAAGTGGMLSIAEEYLREELNSEAELVVFGQEVNPESYAICKSDMMLKGQNPDNIKFGNSFTIDGFANEKFDYMLSNPPFGVDWKKIEDAVRREHEELEYDGRFGAGLPRITDGSLLFLQHMISKMKTAEDGGSKIGIVFNSSPLFAGDAGSGESNIRKWIIENDWLEAIVGLPDQMFYNTGIFTYIWIVNNKKNAKRRGKVQLINAISFYEKMRTSLGAKRNYVTEEQIRKITTIYREFRDSEFCRIFENQDFGYSRIIVERPLKLKFQITNERLSWLQRESCFQQSGKSKKTDLKNIPPFEKVEKILNKFRSPIGFKNHREFMNLLKTRFFEQGLTFSADLQKAIESTMAGQDEEADPVLDIHDKLVPAPELREYENVPLKDNIDEYFAREVKPYVPDAWVDSSSHPKVGYEIPFTRHFYKAAQTRPMHEITSEISELEKEISQGLKELMS